MDKQKQIEEMAKVVRKYYSGFSEYKVVEEIYRILIPDGAVVLDKDFCEQREEMIVDLQYDKFELMNEISEKDNKIKLLEETIECIKFNVNFTRKETAEKFAEMLKKLAAERNCNEDYDWEDVQIDGQIFVECIDEIAKKIAEGRKCRDT